MKVKDIKRGARVILKDGFSPKTMYRRGTIIEVIQGWSKREYHLVVQLDNGSHVTWNRKAVELELDCRRIVL